jgi:glycosyltransferase involved in cell wall biosynthesis
LYRFYKKQQKITDFLTNANKKFLSVKISKKSVISLISVKKKILLCSNILWTITQFRLSLIKALVSAGYEVECVADTDDFSVLSEQKAADAGARFIRLRMNRKGTNPWQDFTYFVRYRKILKHEKPSLVINYTTKPVIYGSLAAWLLRIPSFAVTTGLGFVFINNNLLTRFMRVLYKFSLKFPERVFFLNCDDRDAFLTHHLVKPLKAALLPGEGIDANYYYPESSFKESDTFTFLMIGRILNEKGVREYVEAAGNLKSNRTWPVRCRLAGYLDDNNPGAIKKPQLLEWIRKGIIEYEGPTEDIRPSIAMADCVVLPSYREGVPRTLLEAASMEKPLIAANVAGCRDVVDDGVNGFLCEPRNSRDLYDKMVQMMKLTPEERVKMGQAGRQKVLTQFDEKIVTDIYLREIGNVMG